MSEIEQDFKSKYLKYKYKYLNLKNQLGGLHFNKNMSRCISDDNDNGKYDDNKYYNLSKNQCCKNKNKGKYTDCIQVLHTINRTQIPQESSISINQYKFNKDGIYRGNDISYTFKKGQTHNEIILKEDIPIYTYFQYSNKQSSIKFTYNNKIIGIGAYGLVLQYKSDDDQYHIAVKYGKIQKDIEVLQELESSNDIKICNNLVVNSKIYQDSTLSCMIMENAVGTIAELIPVIKKNKDILIDILYAVVIAIKCLFDYGLYYTDIKMGNILYRNTDNGIQIILGDIGGAAKINEPSIRTYAPYEYINSRDNPYQNNFMLQKKSIISWAIGILILDLLEISHSSLNNIHINVLEKIMKYGGITSGENQYIKHNVDKIISLLQQKSHEDIIDLIKKTLCNSGNRDDLAKILDKLILLRTQKHNVTANKDEDEDKDKDESSSESEARDPSDSITVELLNDTDRSHEHPEPEFKFMKAKSHEYDTPDAEDFADIAPFPITPYPYKPVNDNTDQQIGVNKRSRLYPDLSQNDNKKSRQQIIKENEFVNQFLNSK